MLEEAQINEMITYNLRVSAIAFTLVSSLITDFVIEWTRN